MAIALRAGRRSKARGRGRARPSVREVCLLGVVAAVGGGGPGDVVGAGVPGRGVATRGTPTWRRTDEAGGLSDGGSGESVPSPVSDGPGRRPCQSNGNRYAKPPTALRDRDPSDPLWQAVELAQRGRMILDVSAADLEASEAANGPFHATTWHFRNAWYEAKASWDRLRAEIGGATLDAALDEPPLTVLALGPGAERLRARPLGPLARCPSPAGPGRPRPADPDRRPDVPGPRASRARRWPRCSGGSPGFIPRSTTAPITPAGSATAPPSATAPSGSISSPTPAPHALCKHLAALAALGWI